MAYAGKSTEVRFQPPDATRARERRATAVATGLLVGLILGAGVALLFAPREGSEVRRAARHRLRRLGWRGQDAWLDLREELRRAGRKARRARLRAMSAADVPGDPG